MQSDIVILPFFAVGNTALHIFEVTGHHCLAMSLQNRHVDQKIGIQNRFADTESQVADDLFDDFVVFRVEKFDTIFFRKSGVAATIKGSCVVSSSQEPSATAIERMCLIRLVHR